MVRPKLLDLFCGAGGASVGYHRAGFDVTGVDIFPQPDYPFEFLQGDAMTILQDTAHFTHRQRRITPARLARRRQRATELEGGTNEDASIRTSSPRSRHLQIWYGR